MDAAKPALVPTATATRAPGCISGKAIVVPTGSTCAGGVTPGNFVTVVAQAPYKPIFAWPQLPRAQTLKAMATVRIP